MKPQLKILITALMLAISGRSVAQCSFHNDAFIGGEFLSYNLYYNWQFIWVKAGSASMYVVNSSYNGTPAYRGSLTTRGNGRVDNMFVLRDTLLSYSTKDLQPLYFRKGAREGKRYNVDEVFYTYSGGKVQTYQTRKHTDGRVDSQRHTFTYCVYDMLNIFLRARSFDPTGWKKGHDVDFSITDGKGVTPARLRYIGKANIKADNGKKYRCLQLAYMEKEDGKYKRIVDFYVSDDANHVPIRLDMFLRFGSAKAFLVGMKGLRNPVKSLVK